MAKDPAFLFYSNDFYEGTRMMLPEERACYVDLLIYQHQHGPIPNDFKRLIMYCSGCTVETIQNVLETKFNQTVTGWSNQKLNQMVNERSSGRPKKMASATFAGMISTSKLNKKQKEKIKKSFQIGDFIYQNELLITDENIIKTRVKVWFKEMVDQMVNNLEDENENRNEDKSIVIGKGGMGEKQFGLPELDLSELKSTIENEQSWKETICRNYKQVIASFNLDDVENWLEIFFKKLENEDDSDKTLKDFKKHFANWLKLEMEKQLKNTKNGNIAGKSKVSYSEDFLRKVANKVQS